MKDFTRDPVALKALEDDPLTKDETQPAATVAALVRADERLHESFGQRAASISSSMPDRPTRR